MHCRYWSEEGKLKSRSGTPVYMAPEVILQVGYHEHKLNSDQCPMHKRNRRPVCPAADRKRHGCPLRSAGAKGVMPCGLHAPQYLQAGEWLRWPT